MFICNATELDNIAGNFLRDGLAALMDGAYN